MTLNSPGVQVTVNDLSNYTSAPTGTVPLIVLATAQNKINPAGALAAYTTANAAGQLFLVSSKADLVTNYGQPTFFTSGGTAINGDELNEYGLLTAYSALGVSNAAYVLRADVDLNSLLGKLTQPSAPPADGTLWLDTGNTVWGIFAWNSATQSFTNINKSNTPGTGQLIVITDPTQTADGYPNYSLPLNSLGKPGDYAVVTTNVNNPVWFKDSAGNWVEVGTAAWQTALPTIVGTVVNPTASGNIITLNGANVTLSGNITSIVTTINAAAIAGVTASAVNGQVAFYVAPNATNDALVVSGVGTADLGLLAKTYNPPLFVASPHTSVPQWNSFNSQPRPSGSVWFKTTSPAAGASFAVKRFSATTGAFSSVSVLVAANDAAINYALDPVGGGVNVPTGSLYFKYGSDINGINGAADFSGELLARASGPTIINGSNVNPTFLSGNSFTISSSVIGSSSFANAVTITVGVGNAHTFVNAVNSASIQGITASVLTSGAVSIENTFGGSFILTDGGSSALTPAGLTAGLVTNWLNPVYAASSISPTADPVNGTNWYFNSPTDYDILVNNGNVWYGYQNESLDSRGYDLSVTDPAGPIVMASAPTLQSDGTPLAYGDLWVNTSNLDTFPLIYRWQLNPTSGLPGWTLIDNTDHVSSNGIIFADARWAPNGNTDPATGGLPTITSLLTSNYVDLDAPQAVLYPKGTLLFNTRRSSLNVKQFTVGYFSSYTNPPAVTSAWVSTSGNDSNGVVYLGRHAQRNVIVKSLIEAVDTSAQVLEEVYDFNLITCPGYPELHPALRQMNVNKLETAFIIGDSPFRLPSDANSLNNWANNLNGAVTDGELGLVTEYDYLGVYYPSALTTDLSGNQIVAPSSYMALRTMIQSDNISYPWFAPAGIRRGLVDNATSVGYIDSASGNFVSASLPGPTRDVLYEADVNPIPYLNGSGVTIYGQKTHTGVASALDRINVARLVVYLRQQIDLIAKQYVFEPNDPITRTQIKAQIEQFLNGVMSQRGLNDYAVVCDTSNNPPAVIDQNEMYVDIAIEPTKSAEYIYIPISILNTGAIAAQASQ